MLELLILLLVFFLWLFINWRNKQTWGNGAPYEGTPPDVVARALKIAKVGPGDVFYDLGSGDGRFVLAAALQGARAVGVEIDPLRILYSRIWLALFGVSRKAKIIKGDLFSVNLSDATVVNTYLLPETHSKLRIKLKEELRPGTKVIALGFEYPRWKPEKIDPRGPIYGPIYLYRI